MKHWWYLPVPRKCMPCLASSVCNSKGQPSDGRLAPLYAVAVVQSRGVHISVGSAWVNTDTLAMQPCRLCLTTCQADNALSNTCVPVAISTNAPISYPFILQLVTLGQWLSQWDRANFDTPGSETLMKLVIYNYIRDMTTHASPYDAVTTWVVCVNSQFINDTFLYVSLFLTLVHMSHYWTHFDGLYVTWRLFAQRRAF